MITSVPSLTRSGCDAVTHGACRVFPPIRISAPDRLARLAEAMLDLRRRLAAKGNVHDEERTDIERHIDRTDREIDSFIYGL